MTEEQAPHYTCEECPFSLLCMAGRLSVKDPTLPWHDTVLAKEPNVMNPPAFLCHECGMFIVSASIAGTEEAVIFDCALRTHTEIDDQTAYIKSTTYHQLMVPDPAHGQWMAVQRCADCEREYIEQKMWGYMEFDAALLLYGEDEIPYDDAMPLVLQKFKEKMGR